MKTTLSDRLSLYLPIVLMGLLALGSWWLVRSAPRPLAAQAVALPENQQDYTVEDFSTQQFAADGHLTSQIWGQQARHYLQADILEIDQVRTRSQGAQGVLTTTSAQRGISNSDASEVQLWGNAKVERHYPNGKPPMVLEGEFLHAWPQLERLRSHLPVTLTRGAVALPATAWSTTTPAKWRSCKAGCAGTSKRQSARASLGRRPNVPRGRQT